MKEKRVLALLLILAVLFSAVFVLAEDDKEVQKSYDCLKEKLGDNCGDTQNTAQNAFTLLAVAHDSKYKSDCKSSLNDKKKTDCWPDSSSSNACSIKATSLAVLALEYINENTDDSIKWLEEYKKLANELTWYLEIDANNATECTINGQKVNIADNKKISGGNPSGLSKAYNNYWFQINDLKKNYTVSCDKDFITALLYKKPGSGVYYVSSETHSAAASDSTTEYVNGYCFATSDRCDYEGTLWATLALLRAGEDITPYIPYITAMSDEASNLKYFPLSFLYMLDNSADDYLSGLLSLQKQNKYWEASGNRFYDTSIVLLALQGTTVEQATNSKAYLMAQRDSKGCWPSDTALILYSGWPRAPASSSPGPSARDCTVFGYYCVSEAECSLNNTLTNFDCTNLAEKCCSVRPRELTCEEKGGIICRDKEECSESEVPASDGSCCLGNCREVSLTNECEDNEGFCRRECGTGETEKTAYTSACGIDEKCCGTKPATGVSWWLIILLIILIILVILAIIFRNQLKIWWFRTKSGFKSKKGPEPTNRPPSPPPYTGRPPLMPRQIIPRQIPPRPMPPRQGRPPAQARAAPSKSQKDREFEETMKRLREMGGK